jgi:REP element-mobilizing transposase RayT
LDFERRAAVLSAVLDRCTERGWTLHAVHIRTTHVHLVIEAGPRPERVMNDLKACASHGLNNAGFDSPERKRWARHGSTRWLWKEHDVSAAVQYVIEQQGEPMSLFQRTAPSGRGSVPSV